VLFIGMGRLAEAVVSRGAVTTALVGLGLSGDALHGLSERSAEHLDEEVCGVAGGRSV